jgi:hypothetical protein
LHATALEDTTSPALQDVARRGALAVVAVPVASARSRESAFLTLATGTPAHGRPGDADVYRADEPTEGVAAATVLQRRTGVGVSRDAHTALVHLGIARLIEASIADRLVAAREDVRGRIGAVVPTGAGPSERAGGLLCIGRNGIGAASEGRDVEIVVVSVGPDRPRLDREIRAAQGRGGRTWIVSPLPAGSMGWGYTSRPTLTVLAGPGIRRGLLSSGTTRTPGLIALTDVAPTLYSWLSPTRRPGRQAVEVRASGDPIREAVALDRLLTANARAAVPVLLGFGIGIAVVAVIGLAMLRLRPAGAPTATAICLGLMPFPIALMLAGAFVRAFPTPLPPVPIGLLVASVSVAVAAASIAAMRTAGLRTTSAHIVGLLTLVLIGTLADAWTGCHLLRASLLSAPGMSGPRFYGVGNEHMGFLVAAGLGVVFLGAPRPTFAALVGVAISVTLGIGQAGANAGGVVTAVAAFGAAWSSLRGSDAVALRAVGWLLCGVAAAGAFAWLDAVLAGPDASHLGAAADAARRQGVASLQPIVSRKLAMALESAMSGPGVFAWAGGAVLWVLAYGPFRRELRAVAEAMPGWHRWAGPAATGAAAALIANDTGLVPGLIIGGSYVLVGLMLRWSATPAPPGRLVE